MKTERQGTYIYEDKGSVHQSYYTGWQKAVENFDKYVQEFKIKRLYQLHSN